MQRPRLRPPPSILDTRNFPQMNIPPQTHAREDTRTGLSKEALKQA